MKVLLKLWLSSGVSWFYPSPNLLKLGSLERVSLLIATLILSYLAAQFLPRTKAEEEWIEPEVRYDLLSRIDSLDRAVWIPWEDAEQEIVTEGLLVNRPNKETTI